MSATLHVIGEAEPEPSFDRDDLARMQLFEGVDLHTVAPLVHACEVRDLDAGDVLITQGRPNDRLYLLLEGRLTVRLGPNSEPLTHIEAGESVGELSLIDHQPASASVVAHRRSRVLVLDEELVWMLSNTSHAVSSNLLFTLVRRMRAGNVLLLESRTQAEEFRFHATVDSLTGLFNRHWLDQMLPRQMHRARTSGECLSLLMVDVDSFKAYNDAHGHPAGDEALCAVAQTLRQRVRPGDMVARYGGEEMLVILPRCARAGAMLVAERLRCAVSGTAISPPIGGELPGVTASFGVAELDPGMTLYEFISASDDALYRAKSSGRNCVSG